MSGLNNHSETQDVLPWHRDIINAVDRQIKSQRMPQASLFRRRPYFYDTSLGWHIVQRLLYDVDISNDNQQECNVMAENGHPNVFFLDVFNDKIGIDAVRQLEQQMWQTAVFNRPKITFVRGVDLLSVSAQNALLKTLEEPPKNVYFVLLVDNISRVLPTIMSRVQRLKHKKIDDDGVHEILHWLQKSLMDNKQIYNEAEIAKTAKLANFAPEQALKLLQSPEQARLLEGEKANFAQFMSGKISATALVDSMDNKEYSQQLNRYQGYVDHLIQVLFEKTAQESDIKAESSIKYKKWQGVSLRSLYRLRDDLIALHYLNDTNVNLPMQLTDYFSRWQYDRTNSPKESG